MNDWKKLTRVTWTPQLGLDIEYSKSVGECSSCMECELEKHITVQYLSDENCLLIFCQPCWKLFMEAAKKLEEKIDED